MDLYFVLCGRSMVRAIFDEQIEENKDFKS
jgi:hypothetical protein